MSESKAHLKTITTNVADDEEMLKFLADMMRRWHEMYVIGRREDEHRARLKIALSKQEGALAASFQCIGPGGIRLGNRVLVRQVMP
jgi:hypothetical protein